jgi:hypothetical protein
MAVNTFIGNLKGFLMYGLDDRGIWAQFPADTVIFLFSNVSRPAVGAIQPPIQWMPEAVLLGAK